MKPRLMKTVTIMVLVVCFMSLLTVYKTVRTTLESPGNLTELNFAVV